MIKVDVSNGFELGCFHYTVVNGDNTNKELFARERYGEHSSTQRLVRVSTQYSPDQYYNTFIHELIEAVNDVYCNSKIKHDEVTTLANGLSQVFKSMGLMFVAGKEK